MEEGQKMGILIENVASNCNATSKSKIRTHFAKIIVGGTSEKPYYNIMYFDQTDREYHIGFGSYCLEYVFQWLSEEFEIIEAPTVDAVPVVRCNECKHCNLENRHCDHPMGTMMPFPRKKDDFCSYGERRE